MPKILVAETKNNYRSLKPGRTAAIDSMRFCDRISLPHDNDNWVHQYAAMDDFVLFNKMTALFDFLCTLNSRLRFIGHKMISHFRSRAGGYFTDPGLDDIVGDDIYFRRWAENVGLRVRDEIRNEKGINNSAFKKIPIGTFGFTESKDTWGSNPFNKVDNWVAKGSGLGILVHYVWAATVEIENYAYNSFSNKFYADFTFTLYDDFGLDVNDILNSRHALPLINNGDGFKAWWVLQRYKCYSPFITKIVVKKRLSIYLNLS